MSKKQRARKKRVVPLPNEEALLEIRPRVRFKRVLFAFFIVSVIITTLYFTTPLSRLGVIYFEGLNTLTRSELISLIEIDEDELFIRIRLSDIASNIEDHPAVDRVNVSRAWMNRIRIEVTEYKVGACAIVDGDMFHILTDGKMLHENVGLRANCDEMMIHGLTQKEVDAEIPNLFVRQLMRVDPEIRGLIQMIEHSPLYGDEYRFSLSMMDGNTVKVTTHTMADELNLYLFMLAGLTSEGIDQTGTFHLDVGGFFEPHE